MPIVCLASKSVSLLALPWRKKSTLLDSFISNHVTTLWKSCKRHYFLLLYFLRVLFISAVWINFTTALGIDLELLRSKLNKSSPSVKNTDFFQCFFSLVSSESPHSFSRECSKLRDSARNCLLSKKMLYLLFKFGMR